MDEYNSHALAASWYKRCDHDEHKTEALIANELLTITNFLFKYDKDYKLTMVDDNYSGVDIKWRKMEVVE